MSGSKPRVGAVAGAAAVLLATVGVAGLAPAAAPAGATGGGPPTYQWPEFHNTADLQGTSADPTITSSNAHRLGVHWMSPIGPSLASPMVAYNATLGETLAYVGTKAGYFDAVNVATGQIVWSLPLGTSATSSPLVEGGNVWIAPTANGRAYKLDAATGAVECSANVSLSILATPVIATPPGGSPTVYFASLGGGSTNGHVWAFSEADCSQQWAFSNFHVSGQDSGVWDELSYDVDATGEGLLVFGSANPDSSVYALDARTGSLVWRYQTYQPSGEDWDVGAGVTLSAPGVNGFADGMAYVDGKDGIFYAIDLTTGALVWQYNFAGNGPGDPAVNSDALTAPALSGTTVVFGATGGEWALNAVTGALLWKFADAGDDINSSAAIIGPQNGRVAVLGTLNGAVDVLGLQSGKLLYQYQTGNSITSSPADVDGNIVIASEDGFLYDFALGGGNGSVPSTSVTSPAAGAQVTNPDGPVTVTGTASAPDGVAAVDVEVQEPPGTGKWLDSTNGSYGTGMAIDQATLADPGATSTTWSLPVPTQPSGGSYQVLAIAVGANGVADPNAELGAANAANVSFSVAPDASAPQLTLGAARAAPGATLSLTGSGFPASKPVTVTIPVSSTAVATLITVTATSAGAIPSSRVTLPSSLPFGSDTVTAKSSTGTTGSTQLYISNESTQAGYGPQRTGTEPDDRVLQTNQATNRKDFLNPAWTFSTGGAVDSSPAVAGPIAYLGDEAGDVYGVTVTTGEPVWSTSVGSGVESSPSVDPGDHEVIFGDDAGSVVALHQADGSPAWSTHLGGKVTAAVAFSAGVVYAATDTGVLAAINAKTGTVTWSKKEGLGSLSTPAVDPGAHLIVAGGAHGSVAAFSTADGTRTWNRPTGAAVTAGAAILSGRVFIGSTSGTFYALNEATGAVDWSASTGAPVTAAPDAVASGAYVVEGNQAGDVSSYRLTGGLLGTEPVGHPIAGMVSSQGISIASTTTGELALNRSPNGVVTAWKFSGAASSYAAPGVILNGELLMGGGDQLEAFSIPGRPLY